MAESLAAPLLQLIPLLLERWEQESCFTISAKTELQNLKHLIEAIEEVLEEANSSEVVDKKVKASMKQMRKFIYDSQDAIDDYVRRKNFQLGGPVSYFYERYNCKKFVSEAQNIRMVVDYYKSTRNSTSAMVTQGQSSTDHAQSSSASHQSSSIAFSTETDDKLVGIEGPRDQLVQWLTDKNSMSKVIFVHGAQGVGKTSLVGAVLRSKEVKNYFKYYVWIRDLRVEVLMQANVELWDLTKKENRQEQVKLEQAFQRMEEDHNLRNDECRWALILDDISNVDVIDALQNHLDPICPSVLITTRISSLETRAERLASTSRDSVRSPRAQSNGAPPESPESLYGFRIFNHVFQFFSSLASMFRAFLDPLGAQFGSNPPRLYAFHNFKHVSLSTVDSLALFRREMFSNGPCSTALTEVSDSILEKCEGLPLAILATCDLFRTNKGGVNGNSVIADWEMWNCRLVEELLSKEGESNLIRRMITLRMDHSYGCLYYLSMFPLDCHIRCSTLMRLWMAERFAMQKGHKTDQTIAEENLKKILDRNLVQEVEKTSYGRVRICRIHKLLHEIIIKKSKDDDFTMIVADQKEEWPEIIWRLSIHSQMDPKKNDTRVKRLRSLLVFKDMYPKSMTGLLEQVDRLIVLHLEAYSLNSFPKGILSLKYLRYLKLRGTSVESIPNGIRHLAHLETLDLKGTGIRELPDGILALKALRHLLVYRSDGSPAGTIPKHGVKVPRQLGVMKSLQKLCLIKLDEVKGSISSKCFRRKRYGASLLAELGELEHLQRLGISELKSEDMGPLCSSIEKLKELQALHLITATGEILDLSNVDESKAPRYLQRVQLTGGLGALPNWILSRKSLTKLVLKARPLNGDSHSQLEGDQLQRLRELPYLKHLELEQAFDAPEMTFEAGEFQELRFLGLDKFDKLASLNVDEGALPTLEKLSLARCQSLTRVPQDITRPRNLKFLELYGMPEQFMIAVERNKEVHKRMKVVRKDWNDGTRVEVIKLPANRAGRPPAASASTD